MLKKYQDVYASVFLIAFAVAMYISTFSIKALTISKIGADFMPKVVAIAIFILSIVLLVNSIKQLKTAEVNEAAEATQSSGDTKDNGTQKISVVSVLLTIGLMIVYVYLIPMVGFLIMTTVYLFLQMYLLAEKAYRRTTTFLLISVISSVAIYYVFKTVFHLRLPAGILG